MYFCDKSKRLTTAQNVHWKGAFQEKHKWTTMNKNIISVHNKQLNRGRIYMFK